MTPVDTACQFHESPARLSEAHFVERFGAVYEHSPWIAERLWQQGLTEEHASVGGLARAMAAVLERADSREQLKLIRAHPHLAGQAVVQGGLTADSNDAQSSVGLDRCTPEEFERFQELNNSYVNKFGFPFVMAVRGSNKHQILAAFEERLGNDSDTEFARTLAEINHIAALRLKAMADCAYPRDLLGYAGEPPAVIWPGDARLALQFVINYEEGAESCILHGDAASEAFLSEILGAQPINASRHMNMESIYEYGSRAGFWRLHRLFTERGLPVTVFGVAMALERNPAAVRAMQAAGWEIASHGYRWINYQHVDEATEREHLALALEVHARVTGERPEGWYLGRCSPNTHRLVAEYGNFLYHADSYADDLPYWDTRFGEPQLVVPYTLDVNDMRFASAPGFNSGTQFFTYLKDSFDVLYAEGESAPKMLSVGLHCRLIGRPGRAAALARFLDYAASHERVWVARRIDIARHWRREHPCLRDASALSEGR